MKRINEEVMRQVNGGGWKCNRCGAKFWTYVGASFHQIGTLCTGCGFKWIW